LVWRIAKFDQGWPGRVISNVRKSVQNMWDMIDYYSQRKKVTK